MPLIVRNNEKNPVVFAKGGVVITWNTAGDRQDLDVQMCPDALAEDMDFLTSIRRGQLTVEHVSDPILKEKMEALMVFTGRMATPSDHSNVEAILDRRQDRDIVGRPCIGPDERGNDGKCGAQVLNRAANIGDEPPLCTRHQSLINQFYLAEKGSKGEGGDESRDGIVTREWKRVQMTAPMRG